jgi:citrate synthase
MSKLKQKLIEKIEQQRPRTQKLFKEYGNTVVDKVTVSQILGGMRGIKCLVTDISYLDPNEGIRYRGYTLPEIFEKLPKPAGVEMPYVEGLLYLLFTGDIPTEAEVKDLIDDLAGRRMLPKYVYDIIDSIPDCHPMTIFSAAILALSKESIFNQDYNRGVSKMEYWDSTYEDALNLLAKLPEIGAYIYTKLYRGGKRNKPDDKLDFGGDFANMIGIDKPYDDVSRMYFILHADHESGNVSAHTGHLVASSLSDIYLAISAMLNGLAGPLHGLANQEVLRWIQDLRDKMEGKIPSEEEMKQFVWDTLNAGQVIPGFGHAVLRKTDPRYMMQRQFALKHMKDYELFQYVDMLFNIVPPILTEQGKAKNPWPNVDAHSGVIQWYYGVTEYDFYTVLFGMGRAIGVCANIIWDRALLYPIERPKSLTTPMIEELAKQAAG